MCAGRARRKAKRSIEERAGDPAAPWNETGGECGVNGMGKMAGRLKKVKLGTWLIVGQVVLMILVCFVHAVNAGRYADFHPINGTFQNYNPVRRLLSGQIPYRDFTDYLGMGHLYTGSVFTLLLGGSYDASLIAFSFITFGAMGLICLVLGRAVLGRWQAVLAITNMFLLMLLVQPTFYTNGFAWCWAILNALNHPLAVGNSARFVRGLVLPLSVILYWLGGRLLEKALAKWPKLAPHKGLIALGLSGALGGFAFLWSNDFGICSWLSLAVITFLVAWRRSGKFLRAVLGGVIYAVSSAAAVAVLAEILTLGHLGGWVRSTFGTGGFQGWYYNTNEKSYYFFHIDLVFPVVLQGFVCLVYLILLLVKKATPQAVARYGVPLFLNMAGFVTTNAYKLISSGSSRQVALACMAVCLFYEGCLLLAKITAQIRNRSGLLQVSAAVLCAAWLVSTGMSEFTGWMKSRSEGTYIPAMGGVVTDHAKDLAAASEFLQGESFFSTYASAQEVVEGKFQPSGTDYIIHALGDSAREDYLAAFDEGDFTYAATICEEFSGWSTWEIRADWYFHRKLYRDWHPVFANSYELYWARGNTNAQVELPQVEIVDVSSHTKKLVIQTDPSVNGIADVYLDYEVELAPGLFSMLTFQSMLQVSNTGTVYASKHNDSHAFFDSNQIRPVGAECIPVQVVDGYGEVTLVANPQRNCLLHVNEARCEGLYTSAFDYLPVTLESQEDGRTVLKLSAATRYLSRYEQCLKGAVALELESGQYPLVRTWKEEGANEEEVGSMYIMVEGDLGQEVLSKGNVCRVVRE